MAKMENMKMLITSEDNGKTCPTGELPKFTGISAIWRGTAAPAGTLAFTVDGYAGEGGNIIDLSAGERAVAINTPLGFVDVAVAGLPAGGAVTLYFR